MLELSFGLRIVEIIAECFTSISLVTLAGCALREVWKGKGRHR